MNEYPAIKITFLFVAGIILQYLFHFRLFVLIYIIIALIIVIALLFINNANLFFKFILLSLLLLFTSSLYFAIYQSQKIVYPFELEKIRNSKIVCRIESIELLKEKKLTVTVKLLSFGNNKVVNKTNYKLVTNFWKDTTSVLDSIYDKLKIGNVISFTGTIKRAKNRRNPNEFDYEEYLSREGIVGIINCYKPETIGIINKSQTTLPNIILNIRKAINERIKLLYPSSYSALLKGLLLADRSDINYKIKLNFMNTGVIHVLAVSGLHVGFISLIFLFMFARAGIRIQYVLTIIGILFFLIITGGNPSVFRASVMAVTFLIAKLSSRGTNGINSLAIAALIILLINPNDLFNPGFLLSFSAVISILLFYPILNKKLKNLKLNKFIRNILMFLSVTFVAQLGTLPFTLIYFNKLSVISLLVNLIVIPIIGIIVGLGILSLIFSIISIWLASFFATANIMLVDLLYMIVSKASALSFSFIPIYNYSIVNSLTYYFFLLLLFYSIKNFIHIKAFLLFIILSVFSYIFLIQLEHIDLLPAGNLNIVAIDVGQGDAFLIKFPNNKSALIDAGNRSEYFDNGKQVILPLLNVLGIDKLDYAFISHLDTDHFGGIVSLVSLDRINYLYKPLNYNTHKDSVFENYLNEKNVAFGYYSKSKLNIGGCNLYFLNDTTDNIYKYFDINNKSGIIKLVYGKTSFLFVGDLEEEGEVYLINRYGKFLKSDVLKIGHHGSITSSSVEFLKTVKPSIGIISAGILNKFHHPSNIVLHRLKKLNIKIRRTDKEGAIILSSDGDVIKSIAWK